MATIIDSTGTPASESSALSIIDVTLDIRQNKMVSVLLKQYNKQSQQIKFTVTDNGEKIELKEIEHTVLFKMMTPDGRRVSSYCAINENDHTAVLTVAKNYCSYPGKGTAELEVMDALEESQVGTMNMDVIIENSVYPDEMINGSSTYQGLDEKINAVREACNSAIVVKEETESIRDETETIHDECVVLNNQTAQNTQLANDYANMAQSYANGESGTREREETDNAKYYYNQTSLLKADTETIKTELLEVQEVVNQKASAAESYATNASNSATEAENSASQTSADREVVTALANEVNNKIGSPLTASAASDMTNQNKIYVYTGSEEGYIFGNWYYYDGSTWVSGGVYNSTAFKTDSTLTYEGEAADSKATGDALDLLKSDLSKQKSDSGYEAIDVKWNKNKILVTDTGQVDVNFEYPLDGWSYCILDCHEGDAFIINGNSGTSNPHAWYFADSEYSLISRSYAEDYVYNDYLVYAPKNATKLIIHTKSEKNIYFGYFPKWMIPKQATPEMFGANGDGISNDTNALKKCFASIFDTIRIDKQYLVNEPIDCIGKNVIGTGCIVFESSETLKQGIKFTDCNVNGITFKSLNDKASVWLENGDGKFYSNIFVWSINSEFKNCRFENLEDLRDDGSVITDKFIVDKCTFVGCSEGIVATNCDDIRIQNCNIKCLTYGGDLAHCIYISGGCNYTIIEDCVLGGSDMYPIQTYNSKSGLANPNNVKISGCTINNVKSAISTNAKNTLISNCVISCRETFVFANGEHLDVISNNIECGYILYNIEENIARLLGNIIKCNELASTVNIIKLYSAGNMYIKAGEQRSFMYAGQKEISMLFNNDSFIGFKSSSALFVGEDGLVRIIGCYIQEDISIIWRKQSYFKVHMINNTIDGTASIVDESVVTNNNNVKIDTSKR